MRFERSSSFIRKGEKGQIPLCPTSVRICPTLIELRPTSAHLRPTTPKTSKNLPGESREGRNRVYSATISSIAS